MRTLLIGLIACGFVEAKSMTNAKGLRKPAQITGRVVRVTVVYGDKISNFILTKDDGGAKLEFSNSDGRRETRRVSSTNFAYLKGKLIDVGGPNNDRAFCVRNHILVNADERIRLGCIGAQNPLALSLTEGVNGLTYLF